MNDINHAIQNTLLKVESDTCSIKKILFSKLSLETKTNFKKLFLLMAENVNLETDISYIKYKTTTQTIRILNFTKFSIKTNETENIINDNYFLIAKKNLSAYNLFYSLKGIEEVILQERKELLKEPKNRQLFDLSSKTNLDKTTKNRLFNQKGKLINNSRLFINQHPNIKRTLSVITPEAILIKNPTIVLYKKREAKGYLTLLNYTNHKITFDIYRRLQINNQPTNLISKTDNLIIAYHERKNEDILFIEQKEESKKTTDQRLVFKLYLDENAKEKFANIILQTKINRAFEFWFSLTQNDFKIHKMVISIDIIKLIIKQLLKI